jgi:hypothetical protein
VYWALAEKARLAHTGSGRGARSHIVGDGVFVGGGIGRVEGEVWIAVDSEIIWRVVVCGFVAIV